MGDISKRGRGLLGGPQAPKRGRGLLGGPQAPSGIGRKPKTPGEKRDLREKGGQRESKPSPDAGKKQKPGRLQKRGRRIKSFGEEVNAGPTESLGVYLSGGYEGKPHSTKKGRLSAAANFFNRAWGQKQTNKKKKGISV
jgi:hypothetical protein